MVFFSEARGYGTIHKTALHFHWPSRWSQRPSFSPFSLLDFADEMLLEEAGAHERAMCGADHAE